MLLAAPRSDTRTTAHTAHAHAWQIAVDTLVGEFPSAVALMNWIRRQTRWRNPTPQPQLRRRRLRKPTLRRTTERRFVVLDIPSSLVPRSWITDPDEAKRSNTTTTHPSIHPSALIESDPTNYKNRKNNKSPTKPQEARE